MTSTRLEETEFDISQIERSRSAGIVNFTENKTLLKNDDIEQYSQTAKTFSYDSIISGGNGREGPLYMQRDKIDISQLKIEEERLSKIAVAYLWDYEYARKATLFPDADYISAFQLKSYEFRSSPFWQIVFIFGTSSLFFASYFEGNRLNVSQTENSIPLILLTTFSIIVYCLDLLMVQIYLPPAKETHYRNKNMSEYFVKPDHKEDRKEYFTVPLLLFFVFLIIETWRYTTNQEQEGSFAMTFSGILKPMVLFYYSSRARDAFRALTAVLPMLSQIIFLEMFLIFIFAVMGCELYGNRFPSTFGNLPTAFVSMFELSTTVTNPSAWIEIYSKQSSSALFFISFLILNVFYMHSLVLSVVFQSYVHKMTAIRRTKTNFQEKALLHAFQALNTLNRYYTVKDDGATHPNYISTQSLYETLKKLRYHYGPEKIQVLVGLVDKERKGFVDFHTFRTRLPATLKMSLTSKRASNSFFSAIDAFAIVAAMINFIYVVYFSWFLSVPNKSTFRWGLFITMLTISDLWIRINPFGLFPNIKFDNAFDSLACMACSLSIFGLFYNKTHPEYILVGRSLDLFQCLRFFAFSRDIIKRSGKVLPAFIGPLILTASAIHIFCRIGMHLWGGKIYVGTIEGISPFYDYNNFNSYVGGLITMFQVLVVNDWNQIAKVFISLNHPLIVYSFFILGNIVGVSILLNIFLSFFIGAFITPTPKSDGENNGFPILGSMTTGVNSDQSTTMSIRNIKQYTDYNVLPLGDIGLDKSDIFDDIHLSERQDFDNIMRAAAGDEDDDGENTEKLSHLLELFEQLTPALEKVGFLLCNSLHQYGNRRFQQMINKYMNDEVMHEMIEKMNNDIISNLGKESKGTHIIQRTIEKFDSIEDVLEVKGSVFDKEKIIILFVAREIKIRK